MDEQVNTRRALLAMLVVLQGAVALRVGHWSSALPIIVIAVDFLLEPTMRGLLPNSVQVCGVRALPETTLSLVLFADAPTTPLP